VTSSSSSSTSNSTTAPFSSSNSSATTHQTVFLLSSSEQRAVTTRSSINPALITQRPAGLVEVIDQVPRLDFHRSVRGPAILILLFVTVFIGLTLGKAALESGAFQSFANFYLGSTGGGGI
jgi:hypothetical protein